MHDEQEVTEIEQAKASWEKGCLKEQLQKDGERKKQFSTESGIPIGRLYTPLDLKEKRWSYNEKLGFPGQYPFTRGESPNMYRSNLWRVYQYGGFGTAETTKERFKYTLEQGHA